MARPSLLTAVNAARAEGCSGRRGVNTPLRTNRKLDAVAKRIARGDSLTVALGAAGYRAIHSVSLFLTNSGDEADIARSLARNSCAALTDATIHEIGVERRGANIWVVLAAPFETPSLANDAKARVRVLELANAARASSRRCGSRSFPPAPPLVLADKLTAAASEHARDLADHNKLAHEGTDGSTPAIRVGRTGYTWRVVGENVASGPTSPEEVMEGWLQSPGHCENLMDPRFTEMGLAYVVDARSESGVYWAQVFARPK